MAKDPYESQTLAEARQEHLERMLPEEHQPWVRDVSKAEQLRRTAGIVRDLPFQKSLHVAFWLEDAAEIIEREGHTCPRDEDNEE